MKATRREVKKKKRADRKRILSMVLSDNPACRAQGTALVFALEEYPAPLRAGKPVTGLARWRALPRRVLIRDDGLVVQIEKRWRLYPFADQWTPAPTVWLPGEWVPDKQWAGQDLIDAALRVDTVYSRMG